MKIEYLKLSWSVLLIGLKKGWLTPQEVVATINSNLDKFTLDEELLVNVNINEDNKLTLINILESVKEYEYEKAIQFWYWNNLKYIEKSEDLIDKKLKDIEEQWVKFDYPNEWRSFIYYLPSHESNSKQDIYQKFLDYLHQH